LLEAPAALQLLRPLVGRLSDSVLVSNIGCHPGPRLSRLEFFPVARGRSAVAIGAAGVRRGFATVTLRARDLTETDGARLLEQLTDAL
jgi:hypothetical protein